MLWCTTIIFWTRCSLCLHIQVSIFFIGKSRGHGLWVIGGSRGYRGCKISPSAPVGIAQPPLVVVIRVWVCVYLCVCVCVCVCVRERERERERTIQILGWKTYDKTTNVWCHLISNYLFTSTRILGNRNVEYQYLAKKIDMKNVTLCG